MEEGNLVSLEKFKGVANWKAGGERYWLRENINSIRSLPLK